MRRPWRLLLVAAFVMAAAWATTVLAVSVNVLTEQLPNWLGFVKREPGWWSGASTVSAGLLGFAVWWSQRRYERGSAEISPAMRRPESWVVDRPAEVQQLVKAVVRQHGARAWGSTTAVYGAGGFGKTTVARMVQADRRVLRCFDGRVYWVSLRRSDRRDALVEKVIDLVRRIDAGRAQSFADLQQAADHLAAVLAEGPRRLIIIDDVWFDDQLAAFPIAGKCVRLVTTRVPSLVTGQAFLMRVDRMLPEQSRQVLTAELPKLAPATVEELLAAAGHWPLLLRLINRNLRAQMQSHASLAAVADDLLQRLCREGPLRTTGHMPGVDARQLDVDDPDQRSKALAATIEASASLLTGDDRAQLAELAVFTEDSEIPVTLVATLWRATRGLTDAQARLLCARFEDLALLTLTATDTGGTISLHDVIRDYLLQDLGNRFFWVHQALVQFISDENRKPEELERAVGDLLDAGDCLIRAMDVLDEAITSNSSPIVMALLRLLPASGNLKRMYAIDQLVSGALESDSLSLGQVQSIEEHMGSPVGLEYPMSTIAAARFRVRRAVSVEETVKTFLKLAEVLQRFGHSEEAAISARAAVQQCRLIASQSSEPGHRIQLADALLDFCRILVDAGVPGEAVKIGTEGLALWEGFEGQDDERKSGIADACGSLALAHVFAGDAPESVRLAERAVTLWRDLSRSHAADDQHFALSLSNALLVLARAFERSDDAGRAELASWEALLIWRSLTLSSPPILNKGLVYGLPILARSLLRMGKTKEAIEALGEARQARLALEATELGTHDEMQFEEQALLVRAFRQLGAFHEAVLVAKNLVSIARRMSSDQSIANRGRLVSALVEFAESLVRAGRHGDAEDPLREAIDCMRLADADLRSRPRREVAETLALYAQVLQRTGQRVAAARAAAEAYEIFERAHQLGIGDFQRQMSALRSVMSGGDV